MNPNILLIHGYFNQELSEEEIIQYNQLISSDSDKVLVVCKPTIKKDFKELNVVENITQELKKILELNKKFYLENRKDNSIDLIIYNFLGTIKICIVDRDYLEEYIKCKYKKIVLAGYYFSDDILWSQVLDIDENYRFCL